MTRFCLRPLLAALLLCCPLCLHAQGEGRFWTHGIGKAMKSFDRWLEKGQRSGIDTTYQDIPRLNHQVYLGTYVYWQNYQMHHPVYISQGYRNIFPDLNEWSSYNVNAHTIQSEIELGIDWKGLAIELPIPIRNNYALSLGLAKNGSVWGFRLRYKHLTKMDGYSQLTDDVNTTPFDPFDPVDPSQVDLLDADIVNPKDHTVNIFYGEGYYIFNHRKFSLSAGLYGDMLQKRSAGSPMVYVNYYQSRYSARDILAADRDIYRTQQVSIGAGYGYNFSLLQGHLVLHASAVPMFSLYNHMSHTAHYTSEIIPSLGVTRQDLYQQYYPEGETSFYDAADNGHSRFRINAFARFAANYRYHRCILSLLVNYRHYGYSNCRRVTIRNQEADMQLNLGYLF